MYLAYVIVTGVTIVLNVFIAVADFARAPFVLTNMATVHIPQSWLPPLATLKSAGAVGLLLGLLGLRPLGVAAAIGLVLFFIGALVAHIRARVFRSMHAAGTYFGFAVGSLVLALAA